MCVQIHTGLRAVFVSAPDTSRRHAQRAHDDSSTEQPASPVSFLFAFWRLFSVKTKPVISRPFLQRANVCIDQPSKLMRHDFIS